MNLMVSQSSLLLRKKRRASHSHSVWATDAKILRESLILSPCEQVSGHILRMPCVPWSHPEFEQVTIFEPAIWIVPGDRLMFQRPSTRKPWRVGSLAGARILFRSERSGQGGRSSHDQ